MAKNAMYCATPHSVRATDANRGVTTDEYDIYDNSAKRPGRSRNHRGFHQTCDRQACFILGKRIKEWQFVDVARIPSFFPQAKSLSICLFKKDRLIGLTGLHSLISPGLQ